jgi:HSP20 family molecular chaperone IbpA
MWEPPADIFADGSQVTVIVALPGARVDEVIVQLTPTGLQIDTTVPPPSLNAAMNVVRLEIPYGRMRRRIELPPGRYVLLERRLDRGCLHLRLTREAA